MSEASRQAGATSRLFVFSVCVLVFHVMTSLAQEAVFYLPGFHHTLLLTCAQASCVACFAFVTLYRSLPVSPMLAWRRLVDARRVPVRTYLMIALMNTISVYLSNESSRLLSFSTQVVFKSGKLLVVWLVRYIAIELPARLRAARTPRKGAKGGKVKGQQRHSPIRVPLVDVPCGCASVNIADAAVEGRMLSKVISVPAHDRGCPSATCNVTATTVGGKNESDTGVHGAALMDHSQALEEVASCIAVVVGLIVFTYATMDTRTTKGAKMQESWWWLISGVTGLLVALLCDALMYLGEEKYCFMRHNASHEEVQFYVFFFSAVIGFVLLVFSGDLRDAMEFVGRGRSFITLLLACSFSSYSGTFFLLRIVSEFNSSTATIVTSVRRSLTVLCSYIVYPKPFGFLHLVGITFVMGGVWQYEQARRRRSTLATRILDDAVLVEEEACV
ncbi:hypothetical protein TRSC58_03884 [Trypanosoma rangeli SC58]|uniref:Solute carrier family member b3 n=1 Tax=Trypanosoma rangeli SC58 TaxID=429131 RepID=A0A061IZ24_TRYRA|nr:hypothetical protein TRSC58_03884 [Trypanosoma rangeli SC58]